MNKFILKTIKFLSIPLLASVLLYLMLSNKIINGSYLAALYKFKQPLLQQHQQQKKIIIIGGSNGKFCYYSPIIKKHFPEYEVINASLQGNVGLMHSLNYIKPYLNKDDIVILSPEYAMLQTESGLYGNYQSIHLMSVYNGVFYQNFKDLNYLQSFLSQSFMHYKALLEILAIRIVIGNKQQKALFIEKHHNEYGDIIHAKGKINYVSFPIQIDTNFNQYAIEFLNNYQKYCTDNKINFFVNFPAVAKQALTIQLDDSLFLQSFKNNFKHVMCLNFPSDAVSDKSHFFDSPYHLREKEQHEHTEKLCAHLKSKL